MDKQEQPKVSIIVPVYNVEKYFHQCIESLINQTYKNIELILVDDGSLDNSGKICDEYAEKDPRIIVIHNINNGVGEARNVGIRISSGKYIYFADADDFCEKDLISTCVAVAEKKNCDIVIFGFNKVNQVGRKVASIIPESFVINSLLYNRDKIVKILSSGTGLAVWDKLFKSNLIKDNYILFDKKKRGQDFTFVFCCFEKADSVCSVRATLYNYRINFRAGNKFDNQIIINHINNYSLIKNFFGPASIWPGDIKKYMDNLFILWFITVIPINIANTRSLNKDEKVDFFNKLISSDEFLKQIANIRTGHLSLKNFLLYMIGRTKNPIVLLFLGKILNSLRKIWY